MGASAYLTTINLQLVVNLSTYMHPSATVHLCHRQTTFNTAICTANSTGRHKQEFNYCYTHQQTNLEGDHCWCRRKTKKTSEER
jgi:hypothetical protein